MCTADPRLTAARAERAVRVREVSLAAAARRKLLAEVAAQDELTEECTVAPRQLCVPMATALPSERDGKARKRPKDR